eukprot:CAMPEP_0168525362 /NCGR_PEP_ID=MMETSP0405-20121227/11250_1 /TAXON_ID=498012 /ORGANISM="Trichosphaerium sp, Strain Am-I-7 wt" /LENGTH=278 /DNA_ID=CAMNT_0008547845 /DNA_START=169 /DNA_END=1005 /DNA_ORIENTATION=-
MTSCFTINTQTGRINLPQNGCIDIADGAVITGSIFGASGFSNDCVYVGVGATVTGQINLGGGRDVLLLSPGSQVGNIKMGADGDCVTGIDAITGKIDMGTENDHINMFGLEVRRGNGFSDVVLGGGNDCMFVGTNAKRQAAAGVEAVEHDKKQILLSQMRDVFGGDGDDEIILEFSVARRIFGFNGEDCIVVDNVLFYDIQGDRGMDRIEATNWDSTLDLTPSLTQINGGQDVDVIVANTFNGQASPGRIGGGRNDATCCVDGTVETVDCNIQAVCPE